MTADAQMDFTLSDEQSELKKLGEKIFSELVTPKSLQEAEAGDWFHRRLWGELARAGLLGAALPGDYGGGDLGFIEMALVAELVGRHVAPIPLVPTVVQAALAIARFGSESQKKHYLPGVIAGEMVLSAALVEPGVADPLHPRTSAAKVATGFRLNGVKIGVPYAPLAERIVVAAKSEEGVVVILVDPQGPGVTLEKQIATTGEPLHQMTLENVHVVHKDLLGAPDAGESNGNGHAILQFIVEHTLAALAAIELGIAQRQLEMTSEFVLKRQQFGKPIALFQAVAQRAANAYIDTEAIRLSTWNAVWRLAEGLPATEAVLLAKFWASEGGARVAAAAQHLHGGMGFDKGYPLYRYFLAAKHVELALGGANQQLAALGVLLAEAPPSTAK